MNGDLGKIFKAIGDMKTDVHKQSVAITSLQTQQKLNHAENKGDIEVLFEKIEKVDLLPCAVHVEKFRAYDKHIETNMTWKIALVLAFIGIIVEGFVFASSWGKIQEHQKNIHAQIELLHGSEVLVGTN